LVTALVSRACGAILNNEQEPTQGQGQPSHRTGRLILVMSARGGVGVTSVAVRTAWRLSMRPPRQVVLVDLDLQCGDAALQLDATPNHSLREALDQVERVDDLFLERGIAHITDRLDLFAALEPLEEDLTLNEDAVLALLNILRRQYRYVVVDVPTRWVLALKRVFQLPSFIILVSDAGLASAREVARLRQLLGPNSPERTVLHILNKKGAPGALPLEDFTRGAGQAPDVIIPWSREIAIATALGIKIKPDCPVLDRALGPVFARVAGGGAEPSHKLFSKWLG
jgi:pilus assembly protein CpaE